MGFLGIGTPEMLVIIVAALIIFGPGKLPEVMGQVGKAVRDFRRMSAELTGEFEKTLNDSGVGDLRKSVQTELSGVKSSVAGVGQSVKQEATKAASTVTSATGAKGSPATGGTATGGASKPAVAAASSTAAKSDSAAVLASKADPLADVSLMEEEPAADVVAQPAPTNGARPAAP